MTLSQHHINFNQTLVRVLVKIFSVQLSLESFINAQDDLNWPLT